MHEVRAELGVVEEESGFGCGGLLEGHGRGLGRAILGDGEVGDLAAEGEEVANLVFGLIKACQ